MLILKRLIVWFVETSLEAALLGVLLISLFGHDQHAYFKNLAVLFVSIVAMFFSTGYLFSTGIVRALWQPRAAWLYPVVATVLFLIHFEILNHAAGGAFDPTKRFLIRVAGGCIVFTCTFLGSLLLRNWVPIRNN